MVLLAYIPRLHSPVRLVKVAKRSFAESAPHKLFQLPRTYKPNTAVIDDLPFRVRLRIWWQSLQPGRLETLQNELVDLMLPPHYAENSKFTKTNKKVAIDEQGNFINEIEFEIINNPDLPTKHVVFVHGYGASLGCFARNFQIINKFSDMKHNYKVHFLDNLSFGLSSNPSIPDSPEINKWKIPRTPTIKLHDSLPTDPKRLYNKYYKLIDSYEINIDEYRNYQQHFKPLLGKIEDYYLSAIDNWRINSGIDQIDFLIGHSYGGYWSASYAIKYKKHLKNLILLSPVGVERHLNAVNNPLDTGNLEKSKDSGNNNKLTEFKPSLDPTSYNFLSRLPILSREHIKNWYTYQPFLPRLLKWMGPYGVALYYKMWYLKLFKINKLIHKNGGAKQVFTNSNDLVYGSNKECHLIIEYLYNSVSSGTNSDTYIKYLLTPSTVSKWPLYDKFTNDTSSFRDADHPLTINFLYGQYDFMNAEAGSKLSRKINELQNNEISKIHKISEGGHNLYIDNPFETNQLIHDIVKQHD